MAFDMLHRCPQYRKKNKKLKYFWIFLGTKMRFPLPPLVLPLFACTAAAAFSGAQSFYPASHPYIRVNGRFAKPLTSTATALHEGSLYVDWSSVKFELVADPPVSLVVAEHWSHGNEYLVTIADPQNSRASSSFQLNTTNATTVWPLQHPSSPPSSSSPSSSSPLHITVEKTTEARQDAGGLAEIRGFMAGALHDALPPPKKRLIECIGDSIMCGNHAARWPPYPKDCPTTRSPAAARESSELSWCARVAAALDADYQMVCESGNGLVMTDGATCHAVRGPATCIPEKWPFRLNCAANKDGYCFGKDAPGINTTAPLDPARVPDAVLINLGQNDYGKAPDHLPNRSLWTTHYTSFVQTITSTYLAQKKKKNADDSEDGEDGNNANGGGGGSSSSNGPPKAPAFFLACGGMALKYCNNTKFAVESMRASGMSNVRYLDISAGGVDNNNQSTVGCGNHPSYISHLAMAEIAEPIVRSVLHW